jgi:DnaJ-domain-containing protein 1
VDIFDRLGNLIKTILDDTSTDTSRPGFSDPDESAAWDELEQYMEDGKSEPATGFTRSAGGSNSGGMSAALRKDFRNLELAPGAPLNEVQRSYKKLLTAFHPDRHAADPAKFQTATEVTKRLNESYRRIRTWYGEGS